MYVESQSLGKLIVLIYKRSQAENWGWAGLWLRTLLLLAVRPSKFLSVGHRCAIAVIV